MARKFQMFDVQYEEGKGFYAVECHDEVAELAYRFMKKHGGAFACAGSRAGVVILQTRLPQDPSDPSGIEAIGVPDYFIVEPICDELWNPKTPAKQRSGGGSGPRAQSTHASPTKFVWETCDALLASLGREPTTREVKDVVEPEGVNGSTASTQFYKWRRARKQSQE